MHKSKYWEPVYEDSLDLIAKLPVIAATIYRNTYKGGKGIGSIDHNLDWSANYTKMLGFDDPKFTELMRLYLTIHRFVLVLPQIIFVIRTIHILIDYYILRIQFHFAVITKVVMYRPIRLIWLVQH